MALKDELSLNHKEQVTDVGYLQVTTGTVIWLGQIHEAKNSIQWRIPRTAKHKNSPDGDVKEYIFNP